MQLHKILAGISFTSGLLGIGGMAEAVEYETGYLTSGALIVICIISGIWSGKESGALKTPHWSGNSKRGKRNNSTRVL